MSSNWSLVKLGKQSKELSSFKVYSEDKNKNTLKKDLKIIISEKNLNNIVEKDLIKKPQRDLSHFYVLMIMNFFTGLMFLFVEIAIGGLFFSVSIFIMLYIFFVGFNEKGN